MTVTPEVQLILQLARPVMTDEHISALADLVASDAAAIDSGRVAELAAQHRVAPLVGFRARRLQSSGVDPGIDPMVIGLLEAVYRDTVRRNQVMARQMLSIAEAAAAADIRMVVRKGGHLAYSVYPDPGMRPMSDLDILVEPSEAQELVGVMTKLGYQEGTPTSEGIKPFSRKERIFWHLHGSDLPSLSKKLDSFDRSSVSVDINVALALPKAEYSIPVTCVMKRAVARHHEGGDFLVLDPEDTVIDLCAHIFKSSTTLRFMHLGGKHRRLIKYLDVAEVIRASSTSFSWAILLERVAEYGVTEPTYYALAHLDMLYPRQLPERHLTALRASCREPDALLSQYGQWDLPEPLTWKQDFLTRFFDRAADQGLPPSRSLV
jgi:hypothetical protein